LIGFILSSKETFVRSTPWYLTAVISSILIMRLEKNFAYFFGLVLIVYLFSIWNVVWIDSGRFARPGRTLLMTVLVYVFANIGIIWSIAWCFVPPGSGGEFM